MAVAIRAHPSVADDKITSKKLIQIYQETKSRWGDSQEIIVLTRGPGDSSIAVLKQEIPGFKKAYAESQQAKFWTTLYAN